MSNILFWHFFDDVQANIVVKLQITYADGFLSLLEFNAYTESLTTYDQELNRFVPTPVILPLTCDIIDTNVYIGEEVYRVPSESNPRAFYTLKMGDLYASGIGAVDTREILLLIFDNNPVVSVDILEVVGCPEFSPPED